MGEQEVILTESSEFKELCAKRMLGEKRGAMAGAQGCVTMCDVLGTSGSSVWPEYRICGTE